MVQQHGVVHHGCTAARWVRCIVVAQQHGVVHRGCTAARWVRCIVVAQQHGVVHRGCAAARWVRCIVVAQQHGVVHHDCTAARWVVHCGCTAARCCAPWLRSSTVSAVHCVFRFTGKTTTALNMSSYNYLGFVETNGPCLEPVEQSVRDHGVGVCSNRHELGMSAKRFIYGCRRHQYVGQWKQIHKAPWVTSKSQVLCGDYSDLLLVGYMKECGRFLVSV